jgi:hypothetical protein
VTLYLRNDGDDVSDVKLLARLQIVASQPMSWPPPATGTLTIAFGTATAPKTQVNLKHGEQVPFSLQAADLTFIGTAAGVVVADVGGAQTTVAPLTLVRLPAPSVKVLEADASTGIRLSTDGQSIRQTLHLQSLNQAPVGVLKVLVSGLSGPGAAQEPVQFELKDPTRSAAAAKDTVTLGAEEGVELTLWADLPRVGSYTGTLRLMYGDKVEAVPITVTRAQSVMPVDILEVAPVRATLPIGSVAWRVSIRETAGTRTTIAPPQLTALSVKQGQAKWSADYEGDVEWCDPADPRQVLGSLAFQPGEIKTLLARVNGLRAPGEYEGQLRATFGDAPPAQRQVTLLLRAPWWRAAFAIALGFLVSYLLRVAFKVWRPRLARQMRAARLRESIQQWLILPDLSVVEGQLLDRLAQSIDGLQARLQRAATPEGIDDEITGMDKKLTLVGDWINAWRSAQASQPRPEALIASLEEVRAFLETPRFVQAEFDKAKDALDRFAGDLRKAMRAALTARAKALADTLKARLAGTTDPARRGRLLGMEGRVEAAAQAIDREQFAEANTALMEAQRDHVTLLIDDFEAELNSKVPLGFKDDAGGWTTLKTELIAELATARAQAGTDAERAVTLHNDVYSTFLRGAAEALRSYGDKEATRLDGTAATKPKAAGLREQTAALTTLLSSLTAGAGIKELDDARAKYAALERAIADLLAGSGPGFMMGGRAVAPEAAGALGGPVAAGGAVQGAWSHAASGHASMPPPSVGELAVRAMLVDAVLMLIVFIVALLTGIKLLWLDDPTWGGASASIGAFLWGLGTQQVAGTSFDMGALATSLNMPGFFDGK